MLRLLLLLSTTLSTLLDSNGIWEVEESAPFNELIVSWNGARPREGDLLFCLSLRIDGEWTPYFPYMQWGEASQSSFDEKYIDCVRRNADGFRLLIEGDVGCLTHAHACCSQLDEFEIKEPKRLESIEIKGVPLQAQRILGLCSPTSTAIAIHYLGADLDPIGMCAAVYDEQAKTYGNWVLNVAEASHRLGSDYRVSVERLDSFEALHALLMQSLPVVVSVCGELPGAPKPYDEGHLMVVTGYDAKRREVLVVDPAFPTNEETRMRYPLDDFLSVWGARRNLSYTFKRERRRLTATDADRCDSAPSSSLL